MLKQKLINSAKWNGLGRVFALIFDFSFGIILARLLSPYEFGTIAILTFFISFFSVFINSGFSQALIREKNVSDLDYSTVFYFNFAISVIAFIISYLISPWVADFYGNSKMTLYLRVLSISLFIEAVILVQTSILTKEMNFKAITGISMLSTILAGTVGIGLASNGFGIWSLIIKSIIKDIVILFSTVMVVKWRPLLKFSWVSYWKFFHYGVYILGSSLLSQLYNNVFSLSVGKMFSPVVLGFYNRADLFKNALSQNVDNIITGVSYPALAMLQDDDAEFVRYYKRILQLSFYIVSILMISLMWNAEALINLLLGQKWLGSIVLLQLLCVLGVLFPINSVTVNSISISGRSKVYFKFQLLSIIGSLVSLVFGYFFGINAMIIGFILISILLLSWILYVFDKVFNFSFYDLMYSIKNSLVNIILLSIVFNVVNVVISEWMSKLIINFILGILFVLFVSQIKKDKEMIFILNQIDLFGLKKNPNNGNG